MPPLKTDCAGYPDVSKQSAEHLEVTHASPSTDGASAGINEAEEAPVGPESHGMEELGIAGAGEQLPTGTDSPAASAELPSAEYHTAPITNDESMPEAAPQEWSVTKEQRLMTAEEDVQQQPGVFAHKAVHCMTLSPACKCTLVLVTVNLTTGASG